MRAVVIALGDLGRSARMQYHAHALAANGVDVDLVGFDGTAVPKRIMEDPRIALHRFEPPRLRIRHGLSGAPYAVVGLFDALRLGHRLWRVLRDLKGATLVLVQNPPAFPTLIVA